VAASPCPSPSTTDGRPTSVPPGQGFRPAGDPSLLLAASDGHPAILVVLDLEGDAITIRSAGVDPETIPGFLQRLGRVFGRPG
jgi:hypothetical protein